MKDWREGLSETWNEYESSVGKVYIRKMRMTEAIAMEEAETEGPAAQIDASLKLFCKCVRLAAEDGSRCEEPMFTMDDADLLDANPELVKEFMGLVNQANGGSAEDMAAAMEGADPKPE